MRRAAILFAFSLFLVALAFGCYEILESFGLYGHLGGLLACTPSVLLFSIALLSALSEPKSEKKVNPFNWRRPDGKNNLTCSSRFSSEGLVPERRRTQGLMRNVVKYDSPERVTRQAAQQSREKLMELRKLSRHGKKRSTTGAGIRAGLITNLLRTGASRPADLDLGDLRELLYIRSREMVRLAVRCEKGLDAVESDTGNLLSTPTARMLRGAVQVRRILEALEIRREEIDVFIDDTANTDIEHAWKLLADPLVFDENEFDSVAKAPLIEPLGAAEWIAKLSSFFAEITTDSPLGDLEITLPREALRRAVG